MTRALLTLFLILGQFSLAAAPRRRAAQHPAPPVAPETVVAAARQAAEAAINAGVPAVQIAVSHRGKVIYSEAFGLSDPETATAATDRSVMQVGSLMKQFTSAAILRLAERGALTLDDRIEKFVPEFNPGGATITLRHLLTHTSGVKALPVDPYAPLTREQFVNSVNGQPLEFTPGSKYSYSNAGYKLLGYAIESITGRSFIDFLHGELVLPLGLLHTGVCGTSSLPVPEGYGLLQGTWKRMKPLHISVSFSAGSLCSTASDLARWAHLLATGRVVQPASYTEMTTPSPVAPYGLGLGLVTLQGHPGVSHVGGIDGFLSYLLYFPDKEIGVAVIESAYPGPPDHPLLIGVPVASAALAAL
ncbi:MAG TPA: serine hydrolase domain-containing protein [Thermoanaerobaculia bacterium]|jgi:CubicO group peptidase (beta-lactamase class C family)